jgi:hypothetical protein
MHCRGRVINALLKEWPAWSEHAQFTTEADVEVAIPAPHGSNAGHLIVSVRGDEIWLRFSPPYTSYPLESVEELLDTVRQLTEDRAMFAVKMRGDAWVETALIRPQESVQLQIGEEVRITSWSGKYEGTLDETGIRRSE